MAEELKNTPQAEENSETNPSTQATDKNDVPYTRFQEVNGQKNQFKSENEGLKDQLAKLKAGQEEARQESLKKNSEYETLYNEADTVNKKQAEQIKAYKARELEESERLDAKIPEDQRVFTAGMTNAVKAQYIEQLQSGVNAGKTDSSRAGTTAKGEFGGYDSKMDWVTKDPEGYEKSKNTQQGGKFGNIFTPQGNPFTE